MTGLLLIVINVLVSWRGLASEPFFDRYVFDVEKILIDKDYKRIITAGFLHLNWMHLFFNMLTLYFFMGAIENVMGEFRFLIIYSVALIGGHLLALYIHRNHPDYRSAGASGAICGIMFASIALFPGFSIGLFFIPVSLPGWFYGLAFILFSMYGIKSKRDHTGNEAHLGGALAGVAIALILEPSAVRENYITILIITVPAIIFLYFIITRPHLLIIDTIFPKKNKDFYSIDHKYNAEKNNQQAEIDRILEKIHRRGMASLTNKEKKLLEDNSK